MGREGVERAYKNDWGLLLGTVERRIISFAGTGELFYTTGEYVGFFGVGDIQGASIPLQHSRPSLQRQFSRRRKWPVLDGHFQPSIGSDLQAIAAEPGTCP